MQTMANAAVRNADFAVTPYNHPIPNAMGSSLSVNPNYQEFQKLAKKHSRIPVAETVVADLQTPVSAFLSIAADEPDAFLLESVENGEKMGRYTFIGVRPYMTLTASVDKIELKRGKKHRVV